MTCIRFALLGSGFIGQVHAASLARHERTVLSMVADADPERAKALASRYGARAVTVAEAINSDAIDAVLIASSTPSHAALLEAAARAGKRSTAKNRSIFRWPAPARSSRKCCRSGYR
jgi:myo-inositol 2-dehydrogenase/D-chiro-inositol 1-dehydrogenase